MVLKISTSPTMNLFKIYRSNHRRLYAIYTYTRENKCPTTNWPNLTFNNFFNNRTNKSRIRLFETVIFLKVFYNAKKVSILLFWTAALLEKSGERDTVDGPTLLYLTQGLS